MRYVFFRKAKTDQCSATLIVGSTKLLCWWLGKLHGKMTFCLTQLLTGHGCFNPFLHRIGVQLRPVVTIVDRPGRTAGRRTTRSTLSTFRCEAFDREWDAFIRWTRGFTMGYLADHVLESSNIWDVVARFVESMMMAKKVAECKRQKPLLKWLRRADVVIRWRGGLTEAVLVWMKNLIVFFFYFNQWTL